MVKTESDLFIFFFFYAYIYYLFLIYKQNLETYKNKFLWFI
jgi:hypothetical protein